MTPYRRKTTGQWPGTCWWWSRGWLEFKCCATADHAAMAATESMTRRQRDVLRWQQSGEQRCSKNRSNDGGRGEIPRKGTHGSVLGRSDKQTQVCGGEEPRRGGSRTAAYWIGAAGPARMDPWLFWKFSSLVSLGDF